MAKAGPVVDLLGVEKTYRDFWGRARVQALRPLTLQMHAGEILALLGPNGAGKSTTIKLILGLLFPTRGRVRVFGGSPKQPETRARLGYLPEETRLHKFLTPRETLDLFGRLHGLGRAERKRRIDQLIAMVGLTPNANRPVGEFSKGMARRIGLAVALSGDPDLLILDEPTSGLDPLGTREIKTLLTQLRERGRSILLSSHLLDDVEDVADRIAILYGGKLQRLGSRSELLARGEKLHVELDRPKGVAPEAVAKAIGQAVAGAGEVQVTVPADRLESLFRRVVVEAEAEDAVTAGARVGGPIAGFLLEGEAPTPAPAPATATTPETTPETAEPTPPPELPRVESLTQGETPSAPEAERVGDGSIQGQERQGRQDPVEAASAQGPATGEVVGDGSIPESTSTPPPEPAAGKAEPRPDTEPAPAGEPGAQAAPAGEPGAQTERPANPVVARLMGLAPSEPEAEPAVAPRTAAAPAVPEGASPAAQKTLARLLGAPSAAASASDDAGPTASGASAPGADADAATERPAAPRSAQTQSVLERLRPKARE